MIFQKTTMHLALALLLVGISLSRADDKGCCSLDYKNCIGWCGPTKDSCLNCNHHDGVGWLENGRQEQCRKRWKGCAKQPNKCCPGLECRPDDNDWLACLPALSTPEPSVAPTVSQFPSSAPSDSPTNDNGGEGCCSLDYKNCIGWCGPTKDSCLNCNHHDGVGWLENGRQQQCRKRWKGCAKQPNKCCPGLECRPDDNDWLACLPALP